MMPLAVGSWCQLEAVLEVESDPGGCPVLVCSTESMLAIMTGQHGCMSHAMAGSQAIACDQSKAK